MKNCCLKTVIFLLLGLVIAGACRAAEPPPKAGPPRAEAEKQVRGAVHLHTGWSSGDRPAENIVKEGKQLGLSVFVFTDSALRRWEYTLLPSMGPLIKKTVEQPSILKMGVSRYFQEIKKVQDQNPGTLLLPATEVAPHYYWEGDPFKKNLVLCDWQKHLLVMGLGERAMEKLPLTSNPHARWIHWRTLLWLWPVALFYFGLRLMRLRKVFRIDVRGLPLEEKKRPFYFLGWILLICASAILAVNFPFTDSRFSPQRGSYGAKPYQELIDYVVDKGGVVFWAHPEAAVGGDAGNGVGLHTPAYPELLLQTHGYHGFALFFEGYRAVGGPGGMWDQVLLEYLHGKRKKPVWALGELDFHGETVPMVKRVDEVDTVFWLPDLSPEAVLIAMKKGRMYSRWNHPRADLWLDSFELVSSKGKKAMSGETLSGSSEVSVHFKVSCSRGGPEKIQVQVIRNGEIWKTVEGKTPFEMTFQDEPRKKSYYRLFVSGEYPMYLATNPIFADP